MSKTRSWKSAATFALVATLAAALSAATLAACDAGQTPTPGPAANGRTDVVIALQLEPANLDFTNTAGVAIPQLLLNNVYETLVKVDQDGSIIPLLATSWEVSADRTQYTFHLREGVTFSDGRPFSAGDVVASFDRTRTEWNNAIARQMDVIETTERVDEHTVLVTLARPSNQWLFTIATAAGAIFPADLDFDLMTEAIGTGPFRVTERRQGDRIILEGREDHWAGPAAFEQVTVRYIPDPTAAVNALRAGDVDMLFNAASGDQVAQLMGSDEFQVIEGTSTGEVLLSFNNRNAPFDDVRVRRAFAHAIDRDAVIETTSGGFGEVVGTMVPPTDPYFEDLSDLFPFDPDLARELLADAGYGPDDLHIYFDVPARAYATSAAELIVSQLADVGVRTTIRTIDFTVWVEQVFRGHDFQMSIVLHVEARDLLQTINATSYIGFDDDEIVAAAEAADAALYDEWIVGMQAVARRIAEEVPAIVLYLAPTLIVANPALTGFRPNGVTESMDLTDLAWAN